MIQILRMIENYHLLISESKILIDINEFNIYKTICLKLKTEDRMDFLLLRVLLNWII